VWLVIFPHLSLAGGASSRPIACNKRSIRLIGAERITQMDYFLEFCGIGQRIGYRTEPSDG
jgi:hypothetical protein